MKDNRSILGRIPRWIYITAGILLVLIITATLLVNYRLKPYVAGKIRTAVSESSLGLYEVDFNDLHISLWMGSISFDSLSLRPDTTVINQLRDKREAPKHIYRMDIKGLAFKNISFWDIYFHKKLDLESIVIYKPEITVTFNDYKSKKSNDVKQTAYQQISKFLRSLHINEIILNEADFKYIDKSAEPIQTTKLNGLNVKVTELRIDSASQFDKSKFFYTQNIQLNIKDHKFVTKDGLYTISIGDLSSSTSGKNLRLSQFVVKPNYPEMEFSRKYKEQHDRYDLKFKEILLTDIDLLRLNNDRTLAASALVINGADVNIFMNRELPPVSFDKGRNYPHMVIRRLKLNTIIDTLQIKNTRIAYSEYNPKSQKKGTVTFDRFNATLRNVSNDSARLASNQWMRANVTTWLMNKGRMDVDVNMNLVASNAAFNFNGTMGKMDMRELNALSRNMSLAEIQSGTINKAEFKVSANLRTSTGYLKLYYNNLNVNVLKKDEDSNELKKRGLISAIANGLVINNDNPGKDGELRIGKTVAERINSASFFNLMWKSIFSGLKESVGFTLKSPDTQEVKAPDKKTLRKQKREQRREEREKKRAENE